MVAQIDLAYIKTRPTRLWPRLISYALFEGRPLTTRGRWFNPIVFGLARFLQHLPTVSRVTSPVFILGTGRSGTTILGIILSMHKEVGFLNEPKAMWASIHPGEDLIGSYNQKPARYRLDVNDATSRMAEAAHRSYTGYLRLTGTQRVVDKYPELIFRTGFVRSLFPDAKFLFLSRNGAETCSSVEAWSQRLGIISETNSHDWWGVNDRKWRFLYEQIVPEHSDLLTHVNEMPHLAHSSRAAIEWIVSMREGIKLTLADPKDTLHIPYEAICASPGIWTRKIEDFLGLKSDPTFINYAKRTLMRPNRTPDLNLPNWLAKIFSSTQAELDGLATKKVL